MESEEPAQNPIGPALIKGLASTNASIRSKNLKTLLNWIPSQTLISDDDLKKLWKSLFYCMWHSDKTQNQTHLINRLSSLIPTLPPPLSLSYFAHFLVTMRREWSGIDHLRLDKFYLLVRHFVRNMFVLLKNVSWDLNVLEGFVSSLENNLFFFVDDNANGAVVGFGNGVCYHVVSVFCDEIKPFLPVSLDVLNLLLRPFVGILVKSDNRVLVAKVKSYVFDCLVKNGKGLLEAKKSGGEVDEAGEMALFGTIALTIGLSSRLYELGSSDSCLQSNRKVLFGLHEEFSRLEKEKASLGVEISPPEVADDEVPRLIPITCEVNGNEDGGELNAESKGKKKKKNSKKSKESKEEVKEKKSKKKKKKSEGAGSAGESASDSNGDAEMVPLGDSVVTEPANDVSDMLMNEDVISNLQKQFEKIAAESGLEGDGVSAMDSPTVRSNGKAKKRKRSKSVANSDASGKDEEEEEATNTEGKSGKRVRFAMKNNLVWKPHSPMPPQSVRIPPSSTPRGSALKKGVSPGPIRDPAQDVKKAKKKKKPSPLKKARKVKSISPAGKRGKKVKPMSA